MNNYVKASLISLILIIGLFIFSLIYHHDDYNYVKYTPPKTTDIVVVPEEKEPIILPNPPVDIVCAQNKGLTYTPANEIDWDYENLNYPIKPENVYLDDNGFYRELSTNAYLGALGSEYTGQYYYIKLTNGIEFELRNTDLKQDIHTDVSNCFTTKDNSIVEMEMSSYSPFAKIGNSLVKGISVQTIYEDYGKESNENQ